MIHPLSRERIQDARRGVPAEEPAGVRVVVDARHQDAPEDPDPALLVMNVRTGELPVRRP